MGLRIIRRRAGLNQIRPVNPEERSHAEKLAAQQWIKSLGSASEGYEQEFIKKLHGIREIFLQNQQATSCANIVAQALKARSIDSVKVQAHLDFDTLLKLTSQIG